MKINQDLLRYLKRKKWSYKEEGSTQFVVKICPFCGDSKNHFYINKITSQYLCWKCGAEGNLYKLKLKLGDIAKVERVTPRKIKLSKAKYNKLRRKVLGFHNALKANKEAKKILKDKWGYGNNAIRKFRLGVEQKGRTRWLVMPQFENKRLVNVKYRTLPPAPKRFRREEGMQSILYNADRIDPETTYVVMFEGESDTITAFTYLGVINAIGVTVGARGFKPEWKDFLDQFEKIYICYDNDIPGQIGAEKLAKRLGWERCYNIEIPPTESNESIDLNRWWRNGHTKEDFDLLLREAKKFEVKDIVSFSRALDDLEADLYLNKKLDKYGFLTPWDNVNKLIGSFIPGDLIVLSAPAKIGKSTFAINLLLNWATQGIPSLFYCLEMRKERLTPKIVSYFRKIKKSEIVREDVIWVKAKFGNKPFYMAHSYQFTTEQIFDTIKESVKRYGIEVLVFDHLHFLIRATTNVSSEVSVTVRDFKMLAEELQIPIILICQPRKLSGAKKKMTYDDLRDSSSIGQDADTVVLLHRGRIPGEVEDGQQIFQNETEVIVDATRYNPGGASKLWYNGALSRYFTNKREERRWLHERN